MLTDHADYTRILDEIWNKPAHKLTFSQVSFQTEDVLFQLILKQKIEAALNIELEEVLSLLENIEPNPSIPYKKFVNKSITVLLEFKEINPLLMENLTKSLHRIINVESTYGCFASVYGTWTELAPLLSPLDRKAFNFSELLPALNYLRDHPCGIGTRDEATNACTISEYFERIDKLEELITKSWALHRYVDPAVIVVEETAPGGFIAVNAAIAVVLNQLSLHQQPGPPPALMVVPINAGSPAASRILHVPQGSRYAREVASALRSHLSIPGFPEGGPGPACRICVCSPPVMHWW